MGNIELRDYLAGQIASGWMASGGETFNTSKNLPKKYLDEPAKFFYRMADAMIEARKITEDTI